MSYEAFFLSKKRLKRGGYRHVTGEFFVTRWESDALASTLRRLIGALSRYRFTTFCCAGNFAEGLGGDMQLRRKTWSRIG